MKSLTLAACFFAALSVASSKPQDYSPVGVEDGTVHIFVLMVPDSTVQKLKKARQEEEAAAGVTETGVYVGQIISGVLGGDVRPIFAGSASFIDEPDVQQGVSTILANVAPSLNNILKQWFARVQTALGISTTPLPGTVLANATRPSNGAIAGQGQRPNQPLTAQQLANLQQQQQLQQQQYGSSQQLQYIPGSQVISGSGLYETTTVEPLPHINIKIDEDDREEESYNLHRVVKV